MLNSLRVDILAFLSSVVTAICATVIVVSGHQVPQELWLLSGGLALAGASLSNPVQQVQSSLPTIVPSVFTQGAIPQQVTGSSAPKVPGT